MILDLRADADAFLKQHVKGALYVHCASGERAAIASAFLAREGREVVVAQGGLD